MVFFFRRSRATDSVVGDPIRPKFKLVRAFMRVIVTCKYEKERMKNNREKWRSRFLAHLSRRLIGELIVYPWSGVRRRPSVVRRSQCSNIFSETTWQIKAKFYVEPPWVGGRKFCSRHLGHMTKMAATPIYGKNHSKSSAPEPADRFPRNLV